jgi:hypothetical protein
MYANFIRIADGYAWVMRASFSLQTVGIRGYSKTTFWVLGSQILGIIILGFVLVLVLHKEIFLSCLGLGNIFLVLSWCSFEPKSISYFVAMRFCGGEAKCSDLRQSSKSSHKTPILNGFGKTRF